jgi:hypothetical protein
LLRGLEGGQSKTTRAETNNSNLQEGHPHFLPFSSLFLRIRMDVHEIFSFCVDPGDDAGRSTYYAGMDVRVFSCSLTAEGF